MEDEDESAESDGLFFNVSPHAIKLCFASRDEISYMRDIMNLTVSFEFSTCKLEHLGLCR